MNLLYKEDFHAWLESQILLIKNKEFDKLDTEHLLEEMEDLGNSSKAAIEGHLEIILIHMLKQKYQSSYSSKSWQDSINNARIQIKKIIKHNPSLKLYPPSILLESYEDSRREASKQTGLDLWIFEKQCPWTIEEVLGE